MCSEQSTLIWSGQDKFDCSLKNQSVCDGNTWLRPASHERVQQRPVEHVLDESISQNLKESFEDVKVVHPERYSDRICL